MRVRFRLRWHPENSSQFSQILENLGLLSEFAGTPVPLEVWTGIAQALADASGYSVILNAEILEPIKDSPEMYRRVGKREIAAVEPSLFMKERMSHIQLAGRDGLQKGATPHKR